MLSLPLRLLTLSILLLSLSPLTRSQSGATFVQVGPVSPDAPWPAPREKANAEYVTNFTTTFYDGNTEDTITLSTYAVLYGGQTQAGVLFNDVWVAYPDSQRLALRWVWAGGPSGGQVHRYRITYPPRSEVAHCQDRDYVQYRAAGYNATGIWNDVWYSTNKLSGAWVRATAAAPWAPRYLASMTSDSTGVLYIAGGIFSFGGLRPSANDVWMSVNKGVDWTVRSNGNDSPGRRGVSLLLSGAPSQLLWLTGVNTGVTPATYYADSWASSDSGTTWGQATGTASFGARDDANGEVFLNGMIVITAGYTEEPVAEILNDGQLDTLQITPPRPLCCRLIVWVSLNGGWNWNQCVLDAEWDDRRYLMTLADDAGRLWIMGGRTATTNLNDVWVSTWSFFNEAAVRQRCNLGDVLHGQWQPPTFCGNGMKCYPSDPTTSLLNLELPPPYPSLTLPYCPACPAPFNFNTTTPILE